MRHGIHGTQSAFCQRQTSSSSTSQNQIPAHYICTALERRLIMPHDSLSEPPCLLRLSSVSPSGGTLTRKQPQDGATSYQPILTHVTRSLEPLGVRTTSKVFGRQAFHPPSLTSCASSSEPRSGLAGTLPCLALVLPLSFSIKLRPKRQRKYGDTM